MREPLPFISIVVPTLNEERHIERCIRSLLADPYPRDRLEFFVVDGGSSDRTPSIVEGLRGEFPVLRLLHNPKRLQSAAFNLALRSVSPECAYILRCDAHAGYTPGFITRAAEAMQRSGAAIAAFADAPVAETCFQAAVAFAQNTPLGVGNAWYRLGSVSRFVEHGKHGCFRRRDVERVAGYDEGFSHNEDSELSLRIAKGGGRIWLDTSLTVAYVPRSTPSALARQYWNYGRGRAQTVLKHRIVPQARQLAPLLLVASETAILLAALALSPLALALLLPYVLGLLGAGVYGAVKRRSACVLLAPVALAIMHHAYAAGLLSRIFGPRPAFRPEELAASQAADRGSGGPAQAHR